jgi:hypothetical protein
VIGWVQVQQHCMIMVLRTLAHKYYGQNRLRQVGVCGVFW